MSEVYFISDLHFGHKNIKNFLDEKGRSWRYGENHIDNMNIICDKWNSVVTKRDRVYVLGDVAFSEEGFEKLKTLKGDKILVRGNHDNYFSTIKWLEVFNDVEGIVRYKNFWLTHSPIHVDELRGKENIHGHVHHNILRLEDGRPDYRYLPMCCEIVNHKPVSLQQIRKGEYRQMLDDFDHLYRS